MSNANNNKKNTAAKAASRNAKNQSEVTKATVKAATETAKHMADTAEKIANPRLSAVDSNVATTDQMVHAGSEAVRELITASTQEAQKTQEKVLDMSRDSIKTWSEGTDQICRTLTEAFALNQQQADALVESSRIAAELGRDLNEQLISETNDAINENIELSKDLLACRTLNDLSDVQRRMVENNLGRMFEQGVRLTEAWFRLATDVAEPINTQTSETARRLTKLVA